MKMLIFTKIVARVGKIRNEGIWKPFELEVARKSGEGQQRSYSCDSKRDEDYVRKEAMNLAVEKKERKTEKETKDCM